MSLSPGILIYGALGPLFMGVVLELFLARLLTARGKGILATLCCLASLVAILATYPVIHSRAAVDFQAGSWDGALSLAFHVDALSLLFGLMGSGLGLIVLFYSIDYMAKDRSATRFYALMLTFIAGLVALVYSSNLFVFYLCWEAMGLCSFNLVGFWYKNREAVTGSRKVLLMTHLAGYGLLAAILLLTSRTGSALWTSPTVAGAFTGGIFLLMLVALIAKSVQFPLHTWIPDAMAAPTPVSALLHAACYVKAGVYLAARMHSFGSWPISWNETLMWIGTISMVVGVLFAMVQHDLKRMLAFHTVSQIGYMITGIGLGTPLGITAGLLHCLSHGFFKGGLFLVAGAVQHETGTRDMNQLGGLIRRMPRTTVVWLISVGSMMGVPLLNGFTSKWLLYTAALQAGQIVPALAAWVVSVGTVFSCVKATSSVFLGATNERTENAHEAPGFMLWGLGLIGAGSVVLGIVPQLAVRYIINPILPSLGYAASVQVSAFGLMSTTGGWSTIGGLSLVVISLVFGGGLVYSLANSARAVMVGGNIVLAGAGVTGGVFTGGEAMPGSGRMSASDFSAILRRQWDPFFQWMEVDRYYQAMWESLVSIAGLIRNVVAWFEAKAIGWILGLSLGLLFAIKWLAPHVAISTLKTSFGVETIPLLITIACAIACCALCGSALSSAAWKRFALLMLLSGMTAVSGMFVVTPFLRLTLLEIATFLAVALVWQCLGEHPAAWVYTITAVGSAVSLIFGQYLLQYGNKEWALALLLCGFFLKLAIVPLFLWLPQLAERLPAVVTGLVIAVLDIGAFGELYCAAQANPWLITSHGIWLVAAIGSALLGAVLMLTEKNLKRLLAFSTVEDMGFLLLGLASASHIGVQGAMFGAAVHALAKALLFVSLSAPEADGALSKGSTGLAARYPISAAGFLAGMLAVLGVPPTFGFIGRWRLYEAAAQAGPRLLALFVLASMLALLAYVRALTRFWWGPSSQEADGIIKEPLLLRITIVGLIVVLLAGGLWPSGIPAWIVGVQ